MDILCLRCAEPWSIDYVLLDEPDGFDRIGCLIRSCPVCRLRPKPKLPRELEERLSGIAEVALMLGDDLDGFAAMLEDLQLV